MSQSTTDQKQRWKNFEEIVAGSLMMRREKFKQM